MTDVAAAADDVSEDRYTCRECDQDLSELLLAKVCYTQIANAFTGVHLGRREQQVWEVGPDDGEAWTRLRKRLIYCNNHDKPLGNEFVVSLADLAARGLRCTRPT